MQTPTYVKAPTGHSGTSVPARLLSRNAYLAGLCEHGRRIGPRIARRDGKQSHKRLAENLDGGIDC